MSSFAWAFSFGIGDQCTRTTSNAEYAEKKTRTHRGVRNIHTVLRALHVTVASAGIRYSDQWQWREQLCTRNRSVSTIRSHWHRRCEDVTSHVKINCANFIHSYSKIKHDLDQIDLERVMPFHCGPPNSASLSIAPKRAPASHQLVRRAPPSHQLVRRHEIYSDMFHSSVHREIDDEQAHGSMAREERRHCRR